MRQLTLRLLTVIIILCVAGGAWAQLHRSEAFHDQYTLKQTVVLSRHNIRSPISTKESLLGRVTPHEWFAWSSAPSELSLRGGVLETTMGQFFRRWLVGEGLMTENEQPAEGAMRFYANSMQRTIATAQYFSSGILPVANVTIEHHYDVGTMDPVFTPQITVVSDDYRERALRQIADRFGGGSMAAIGQNVAENIALVERVIDMDQSFFCQQGVMCHFATDDVEIALELGKEPSMSGGLKTVTGVADALVLQYYEEQDDLKAAFGHTLTFDDWRRISAVKDWYGDVLFTAPLVAVNVAHPLLQEILAELKTDGRLFTFLCGHDSNIGSVLAAIGLTSYELPEAVESKTPIGSKLVIEKWLGKDGREYAALNLCYQSVDQLRHLQLLSPENPPVVYPVVLDGLTANSDGLYLLSDLEARLTERIAQYDQLTSGVAASMGENPDAGARYFRLDGTPATKASRGVVIRQGRKNKKTVN